MYPLEAAQYFPENCGKLCQSYHQIIEWFGSEGTFKGHLANILFGTKMFHGYT